MKFLKILEDKNFDFTKKVVDKDYNNALRQIVFYSYIEESGLRLFSFQFQNDQHWLNSGELHIQG